MKGKGEYFFVPLEKRKMRRQNFTVSCACSKVNSYSKQMLYVAYARSIVMNGASVRCEKYGTRLRAVCIYKKQKDATKNVGLFFAVDFTAVLIFGSLFIIGFYVLLLLFLLHFHVREK